MLLHGIGARTGQYSILSGRFDFDDIRSALEEQDYRGDRYLGHEFWTDGQLRNASKVALIQDSGLVLAGNFDLVPDILSNLTRESERDRELGVLCPSRAPRTDGCDMLQVAATVSSAAVMAGTGRCRPVSNREHSSPSTPSCSGTTGGPSPRATRSRN